MKKRIVRLTEQDLHVLIEDTLKNLGYIDEVRGWELEKDDVTWVNDENDRTKAYVNYPSLKEGACNGDNLHVEQARVD